MKNVSDEMFILAGFDEMLYWQFVDFFFYVVCISYSIATKSIILGDFILGKLFSGV